MSSDTARALAEALAYARRVSQVLVVDGETDRTATAALERVHERSGPPRKLARKP